MFVQKIVVLLFWPRLLTRLIQNNSEYIQDFLELMSDFMSSMMASFDSKVASLGFQQGSQLQMLSSKFYEIFWERFLTLWGPRVADKGAGECRRWSLLAYTHMGRARRKKRCFEENGMNFQKIWVLTLSVT